jgi:hypothetical protein
MLSLLLTFFPFVAAFFGGYVVYRWKQDLHPWLSLSGGLLLGVALLDLLPEAIELAIEAGQEAHLVGWIVIASVLVFHSVDRLFGVHTHHEGVHEHEDEDACHNVAHADAKIWTRASGMVLHRFCDGLAIGGGFLLDPKIGSLIAAAMTLLRNQNAPLPYAAVLSPNMYHNLAKSATVAGATSSAAPNFADDVTRRWWVNSFGPVDIFLSSNIATSGTTYGAMFSRQVIAYDERRAPRLEPQRDASRRGLELNMFIVYGYGVWRPRFGVTIVADGSNPS